MAEVFGCGVLFGVLLSPTAAFAQATLLSLPVLEPALVFSDTTTERTFLIDLETMPTRPVLVVEASPDAAHPDLQIELRLQNFALDQGPFLEGEFEGCLSTAVDQNSPGSTGPNEVRAQLFECDPRPARWNQKTVEAVVRIASLGANPAPASLKLAIRGETRPPTQTTKVAFAPTFAQQMVTVAASKDTTLYQANPNLSNGLGAYLWVGTDASFPPQGGVIRDELRALLAFDLVGPIPATAQIDAAEIELSVVQDDSGSLVELHRVGPGAGSPWAEGSAIASGNQFQGALSPSPAATWDQRQEPGAIPWDVLSGGDFLDTPLQTTFLVQPGETQTFASSALTAAVGDMVANGTDDEGFGLRLDDGWFFDEGVRFGSRENFLFGEQGPQMTVWFTPTVPYQEEELFPGVLDFIDEGEDFRWIYDLDQDDILVTDIGGVCTVLEDPDLDPFNLLPYTYQFEGDAGFVGVDCCAWRIDSVQTGTVGTGQAIFFHNLDPAVASNTPPDFDGDGILDPCDNCIYTANGPFEGTCFAGAEAGNRCHNDAECPGSACSLSQEDADLDQRGDVCAVPEPSFGGMLFVGAAGMSCVTGRRRVSKHGEAAAL